MFSAVVGRQGHVYTVWPKEMTFESQWYTEWKKLAATKHYANVSLLSEPVAQLTVPAKVDLVFTSQNYHDLHNRLTSLADYNKRVYDILKPGGLYVIIDHVAPAGSGAKDTRTLHRIDPALVKTEVESAGFKFEGGSDVLHNPKDSHDVRVFDKKIRGHTDQFIYRFRKPAK